MHVLKAIDRVRAERKLSESIQGAFGWDDVDVDVSPAFPPIRGRILG